MSTLVSTGNTNTGHFLRVQAYSASALVLFIWINALAAILDGAGILLGLGASKDGVFILPVVGILSSFIASTFYGKEVKNRIKSSLSVNDNEIFTQAKKSVSPKAKLAMLFQRPIREIILFSESNKYNMANTQARLVQRAGRYYIEVETVNALKTWDTALEAVVPEVTSRTVLDAAAKRQAEMLEYSFQKARFENQMFLLEEEMMWIHERQKDAIRKKEMNTISSLCGDDDCHGCAEDYDDF